MALNYSKPFKTIVEVVPIRALPLLCCPTCSSIKASICKKCGTFICENNHNTPRNNVEFYYNKKSVTVELGHDPECTKPQIDGKQIAKEVVDLLIQNKLVENPFSHIVPAELPPGVRAQSISKILAQVKIKDEASTPIEEWRKQNPYPTELPNDLKQKFIGLTSTQARNLYPHVRIYPRNSAITDDLECNRLNLICNDEEAGIIVEVSGFF